VAKEQRLLSYENIKAQGVDVIPRYVLLGRRLFHVVCQAADLRSTSFTSFSGTFTLYDHVLDFSNTFGIIPDKYAKSGLNPLDTYFAMARGHQKGNVDLPATEMQKWFDSNYHFLVPEVSQKTNFRINDTKPVDDFVEAKEAGYAARPVLVGPITLLALSKVDRDAQQDEFDPVTLVSKLAPVYAEMLQKLASAGADWVQIDEPILCMDRAEKYASEFKSTYESFSKAAPNVKILLTTYFGRLGSNLEFVKDLPVAGLHIDLDRAPEQIDTVVPHFANKSTVLSLGLISGRNIWKTDLNAALSTAQKAIKLLGGDEKRVIISSSASLLHTPITIKNENKLSAEVIDWFSFATEKCAEVALLTSALKDPKSASEILSANEKSIKARRDFEKNSDPAVRQRLAAIKESDLKRKSPFAARREQQNKHLNLPVFPTTTIGSFPQTKEIRAYRARFNKGEISQQEYEKFLEDEIKFVVQKQEELDLDVLVHGEPERNDMVQYFGELLDGFAFTQNAWVQSFGSRYVRPPIVVSDVSRPKPMTVRWSSYAQSLTKKTMKGMLTGPVTILNWSFPRADVSKEIQAKQIALALRDEVNDLEKAGIRSIQEDEPALREGLPLREAEHKEYLDWAVASFRLSTSGVSDETQIVSHFCYSDFANRQIMQSILDLDADMISIENSKSDAKILKVFQNFDYANDIGPGVFDIHSPRVPSADEMFARLQAFSAYLPIERLWCNPDCGLKTRSWDEAAAQCKNMVAAAKKARVELAKK
jgi:5-methyltetrahydropteroyltriglutamate--homocysteine methyltransferase